jgi:hypothetical protein
MKYLSVLLVAIVLIDAGAMMFPGGTQVGAYVGLFIACVFCIIIQPWKKWK